MNQENQNYDETPETLVDLSLTTENDDDVKAGTGDNYAQLNVTGQIGDSASSGGGAGKVQVQDFRFVTKF